MNNEYLSYKIKAYLELNNSSSIDITDETKLTLMDHGEGPEISIWNINLSQPTQEQLDSDSNLQKARLLYSSSMYVRNRSINYPQLGEQFDMLYHELATSGSLSISGSWFQSIKNVKDSYPKP
jgi:hypothetical protein